MERSWKKAWGTRATRASLCLVLALCASAASADEAASEERRSENKESVSASPTDVKDSLSSIEATLEERSAENESFAARVWRWEVRVLTPKGVQARMWKMSPERDGFFFFESHAPNGATGREPSLSNPGMLVSVSNVIDGMVVAEVHVAGRFGAREEYREWRVMRDLPVPTVGGARFEAPFCPDDMDREESCLAIELEARVAKGLPFDQ